ncbi:lysozyme inhibitor LprI family protein [Clostridium nigeriense]|uniref:lysozyme inhibitor LprI family protein n=1 Tax=Clostridium nigeriense TaxID=1805470 RepID=UPI003D339DDB
MRKFMKSIIFIVVLFTLFLTGCATNINEIEEQTNEKENKSSSAQKIETTIDDQNEDSIENKDNITNEYSTKQIYLDKLNQLEENLNTSLKEKYASPKTQDMIDAANKEYIEWDNMLNEVYEKLELQLSKEDMDKLRIEELAWIENRDKKSKDAYEQFNGGTIAPLSRIRSLSNNTKSRCYELVNEYMK